MAMRRESPHILPGQPRPAPPALPAKCLSNPAICGIRPVRRGAAAGRRAGTSPPRREGRTRRTLQERPKPPTPDFSCPTPSRRRRRRRGRPGRAVKDKERRHPRRRALRHALRITHSNTTAARRVFPRRQQRDAAAPGITLKIAAPKAAK
jgi:hypothetical protein